MGEYAEDDLMSAESYDDRSLFDDEEEVPKVAKNDLCAQWLFGPSDALDEHGYKLWRHNGNRVWETPNFRTSNEWAGALLEKIARSGYLPELSFDGEWNRGPEWSLRLNTGAKILSKSWRDAVVDAALEVIKRESSSRSADVRR